MQDYHKNRNDTNAFLVKYVNWAVSYNFALTNLIQPTGHTPYGDKAFHYQILETINKFIDIHKLAKWKYWISYIQAQFLAISLGHYHLNKTEYIPFI